MCWARGTWALAHWTRVRGLAWSQQRRRGAAVSGIEELKKGNRTDSTRSSSPYAVLSVLEFGRSIGLTSPIIAARGRGVTESNRVVLLPKGARRRCRSASSRERCSAWPTAMPGGLEFVSCCLVWLGKQGGSAPVVLPWRQVNICVYALLCSAMLAKDHVIIIETYLGGCLQIITYVASVKTRHTAGQT
jgi:hypothetical protein